MKIASLAEVKAHLSEFIHWVESSQEFVVITKRGKPSAILIPVKSEDDLERALLARSPRFQKMITEAREEYEAGQTLPSDVFWEQVMGENAKKE